MVVEDIKVKVQLGAFETAKELLKCFLFAFMCTALLSATIAIWELPKLIDRQADATRAALMAEAHIAIVDANQQLSVALDKLDTRTGEALAEVHTLSMNADARTSEALEIVRNTSHSSDKTLAGIRSDLNNQLSTFNATTSLAAAPIADAATQIDKALPDFLDCQYDITGIGNKNCLYVRYSDLSSSLDRTLSAIAKAAPATADSVKGITANSDKIAADAAKMADKYTQPPTKWQKVVGTAEIFGWIVLKALI